VIARRAGMVLTAMVRPMLYKDMLLLTVSQVCQNDNACVGFPLAGSPHALGEETATNMTCYKGGETVFNNHQMCDVTSTYTIYRRVILPIPASQIARFWICSLAGHHKSHLVAPSQIEHALSNSGPLKWSHFIALWNNVTRNTSRAMIPILLSTPARQ
jgi:hypothetical protein